MFWIVCISNEFSCILDKFLDFFVDFVNFGGQRRRGDLRWRVMGWCLAEARKGLFGCCLPKVFMHLCALCSKCLAAACPTTTHLLSHCAHICTKCDNTLHKVFMHSVKSVPCVQSVWLRHQQHTCHTLCKMLSHFLQTCARCSMCGNYKLCKI